MNKANTDFTDIKCSPPNGETFDGVEETRIIFFFVRFPLLENVFQMT